MKLTSSIAIGLAALVALSACSSTDDDETPATDDVSGEGANVEGADDDDMDDGGMGGQETSMLAPEAESGDQEVSSDPSGDDTGAIAGLWDAGSGEGVERDERYVDITANGLFTDYDYRQDANGDEGNCYFVTPMTLDLETAAEGSNPATFSIADGRSFSATADASTLTVVFLDDASIEGAEFDDEPQAWSAVSGIIASDLPVCADPG